MCTRSTTSALGEKHWRKPVLALQCSCLPLKIKMTWRKFSLQPREDRYWYLTLNSFSSKYTSAVLGPTPMLLSDWIWDSAALHWHYRPKCSICVKHVVWNMSNYAVNVPYRCLVTFRFWPEKEYENTRAASRWVPTGATLHFSVVTHSFLFLSFVLSSVRSLVTFKSWPRESHVRSRLSSRYTCSLMVPR